MEVKGIIFLLIILLVPAIVILVSGSKVLPITNKLALSLISFIILYAVILGAVKFSDYQIKKELFAFDLDRNGSFSIEETTPEARLVMDRYANDTGRIFAPITGFIFSFLYTVLFFSIAKLVSMYVFKNT